MSPLDLALPAAVVAPAGDDDLVARLRRGERTAIGEAYAAHHASVRAFARHLVGDDAAAEDIVHDAFVALPRAVERFRGEAPLRGFLIGVAANQARRHIRSAMRRRKAMARLEETPATAPEGPDQAAARRRLADRLLDVLDHLPVDQRVAFVLCEVEQRTSVEVAVILGVPEGTVRTRAFHARRRLRELLAEEDPRG
ncbi:MAG TPA: RNA polymerase sigma factor [Kofleriaceae bacterium]|nr:RNA polymerase sigma factor [Kofleriaceae bacterium]